MKLERKPGRLTARTNHAVRNALIRDCLSDPIGEVYTWTTRECGAHIAIAVGAYDLVMSPEDAIKVGQALITLGTIAQNPTIIKEETNEI